MPTTPDAEPRTEDLVTRLVRVFPLVLLLALFAAMLRSATSPVDNADTLFHLRFGHEFLTDWSLRHPGSVSSLATSPWVPTQWLSEIVFARFEDWFGLRGVAWLTGLQVTGFVLVLYVACRRWAAPAGAVVPTMLATIAAGGGLSGRPQVLSYLLVVVVTDAWLRTRHDGRIRWWLIPLTWLWTMLHGMWPVGIVIGLVAVAGGLLEHRNGRRATRELAVPLLSAAAAGLTPLGLAAYGGVVAVGARAQYIPEWATPDFTTLNPLALLTMFAVLLAVRVRTGGMTWSQTLLLLLAGSWAVYSGRTVAVSAALAAPLLAQTLQTVLPPRPVVTRRERQVVLGAFLAGLVGLAAILPAVDVTPKQSPGLDAALDALPAGTTLLNEWSQGGYLMWRHPDLDVGMHGYVDTYSLSEIDRLVALLATAPGWEETLESTGASWALLSSEGPLAGRLEDELGWSAVEEYDGRVLLRSPSADG
ncbi:membrane hypothetical protein [metagenome]|uniref:Glycosyltransferase RgtA/B/C/D-like domain-containing protein n=1 Tax=metagenome TaxID=256318 RepID=A0A2P2BW22_9ZZZZ